MWAITGPLPPPLNGTRFFDLNFEDLPLYRKPFHVI